MALAACNGGSGKALTGDGGAGKTPSGDGGFLGNGNCEAVLPFNGDVCKSLVAADFAQYDYSLQSTQVLGGFGGPDQKNTQCLYNVADTTNGNMAQPGVAYGSECDWESTQQVESKSTDEYMTVAGLGDQAFSFDAFGSLVIFVKYKGYVVILSQGDFTPEDAQGTPIDTTELMTTLAKALLARL